MKKSSLVILALVGMVGCRSGKHVEPQKNGMTMRGTEPGQPCVLVGNLVKNCDIDGGVVISKFVECDPLNDFGIKCPAGSKIIGNGGINVGNDPVYSNNPLSHGNEAVILPDKPAKKPAVKKVKPVSATAHVSPAPPIPDATMIPGDGYFPEKIAPAVSFDPVTFATTSTFPPPHAQTTESTDDKGYHYVIDSPDKSFKCYVVSTLEENPRNNYDHDIAAFTVACVKSVEKAK